MQKTTTAIVLRSTNFGEKDKILYLFSLEDGVISAKLKGVRGVGAKMKIFALPFCLAEWELVKGAKSNDFYTVKGANLIDAFYDISSDIDRYCVACIMVDILKNCTYYSDEVNSVIYVALLKSLKLINYTKVNAKLVLCKYLLEVLKANGYGIQVDKCAKCGIRLSNKAYLNFDDGSVKCSTCRDGNSVELEMGVLACIKNVTEMDFDNLEHTKIDTTILDKTLLILKKDVELRMQFNINFAQIV